MATRRKDALPGKEKATPAPKTGSAKLRGAINQISKPKVSTAPPKQVRPALKTATTDVSKVQTRKPASSTTVNKPAQTRTKPLDTKTVTPAPRARVSATATVASPRSSSLTVKAVASPKPAVSSPKPAPAKKWKPVENEEGKRRLSNASSVSGGRRSSIGLKTKENGDSASSATKEKKQITNFNLDKKEDLSMYCAPQPEMQLQDIDYTYLAEAEEKTVQTLNDFDKRVNDAMREQDQDLLNSPKIEDMINYADPTVVTAEPSTVSAQLESPAHIKKELENKYSFKESISKLELEHDKNCAKVEKIAENSNEEAREKEIKVDVEVAAKEPAPVVSKADESKEIERPAVVKKPENSNPHKLQEMMHGKYDSPVSNDVIEETANKLRELRKNRVRALAGAFETVISLQEK